MLVYVVLEWDERKTVNQRSKMLCLTLCSWHIRSIQKVTSNLSRPPVLLVLYTLTVFTSPDPKSRENTRLFEEIVEVKLLPLPCKKAYQNEANEVTLSAPYPLPAHQNCHFSSFILVSFIPLLLTYFWGCFSVFILLYKILYIPEDN